MAADDTISLKRLHLILGVVGGLAAVVVPVSWKFFQIGDHEKRLQKVEQTMEKQNDLLNEIRGDVKALRRDDWRANRTPPATITPN